MIDRFDFLLRVVRSVRSGQADPRRESAVLRDIYLDMERADFSRDFLAHVASSTLVQAMHDVDWSDWSRPSTVVETLNRLRERTARRPFVVPAPGSAGLAGAPAES